MSHGHRMPDEATARARIEPVILASLAAAQEPSCKAAGRLRDAALESFVNGLQDEGYCVEATLYLLWHFLALGMKDTIKVPDGATAGLAAFDLKTGKQIADPMDGVSPSTAASLTAMRFLTATLNSDLDTAFALYQAIAPEVVQDTRWIVATLALMEMSAAAVLAESYAADEMPASVRARYEQKLAHDRGHHHAIIATHIGPS